MSHLVHNPRSDEDSSITATERLPLSLEVTTDNDPLSRDNKLSEAADLLIPAAFERRHGILVTQRGWGRYTIQVDPGVPCGTIHEKRC